MNGKLELKLETSKTAKTILLEGDAWIGFDMEMRETVRPVGFVYTYIMLVFVFVCFAFVSLSRDIIVCCDDDDDMLYV